MVRCMDIRGGESGASGEVAIAASRRLPLEGLDAT